MTTKAQKGSKRHQTAKDREALKITKKGGHRPKERRGNFWDITERLKTAINVWRFKSVPRFPCVYVHTYVKLVYHYYIMLLFIYLRSPISIQSHLTVERQRLLIFNQVWRHFVNRFVATMNSLDPEVAVGDMTRRWKYLQTGGSVTHFNMIQGWSFRCFSSSRQAKYGLLHPEAIISTNINYRLAGSRGRLYFLLNTSISVSLCSYTSRWALRLFSTGVGVMCFCCHTSSIRDDPSRFGLFLLYFFMSDISVLVFLVTLLPVSVALRAEKGEFCFLAGHITSFKMHQRNLHLLITAAIMRARY